MKDGSEFGRQLVEDSYFDDVSAFCASCSTFRSFTGRQSVDVMYEVRIHESVMNIVTNM